MIRLIATLIHPLLVFTPVRRVRRNHALEHATVHMMQRRVRDLEIHGGRAVLDGFFIYGKAETDDIRAAVEEAIDRMRKGEHSLAIHPNCGTGLVTTGFLTTLATLVASVGANANWAERFARLPAMLTLSVFAVIVAQPAGLSLQRYITTMGDVGDLEVVQISRHEMPLPFVSDKMIVHRIYTRAG